MRLRYAPNVYVDGLLVPRGSGIAVDATALELLGIRHVAEVCRVPSYQRRVGSERLRGEKQLPASLLESGTATILEDLGQQPFICLEGRGPGTAAATYLPLLPPPFPLMTSRSCLSSPPLLRRWTRFSILPSAISPPSSAKTSRTHPPSRGASPTVAGGLGSRPRQRRLSV